MDDIVAESSNAAEFFDKTVAKYNGLYSKEWGNHAESVVERYLLNNNIPYKRNITSKKPIHYEFDFVIPGAVIEVKNTTIYRVSTLIEQLVKMRKHLFNDTILYVYNHKAPFNDEFRREIESIPNTYVLDNLNKIQVKPFSILINRLDVVKSLISEDNPRFYIEYKHAYLTRDVYRRLLCIMLPEEQERFDDYDFEIVDDDNDIPHRYIAFAAFKDFYTGGLWQRIDRFMFYRVPAYNLRQRTDRKLLHVEGLTERCDLCHHIYYANRVRDNICDRCIE